MLKVISEPVEELAELKSIRMRFCIATRTRYPDEQLLRVVLDPTDEQRARVVPDPRRRLPGRGAWIFPSLESLELAERHRAFGRALRMSAHVDTGMVREYLMAHASA